MRFKFPSKAALTNIAVCIGVFVAARFVLAPHMKHERATGHPTTMANAPDTVESAAIRTADAYWKSHAPKADLTRLAPVVTAKDDRLEVTYPLPFGNIGGAPVVVIDKATMTVIGVHRAQ